MCFFPIPWRPSSYTAFCSLAKVYFIVLLLIKPSQDHLFIQLNIHVYWFRNDLLSARRSEVLFLFLNNISQPFFCINTYSCPHTVQLLNKIVHLTLPLTMVTQYFHFFFFDIINNPTMIFFKHVPLGTHNTFFSVRWSLRSRNAGSRVKKKAQLKF